MNISGREATRRILLDKRRALPSAVQREQSRQIAGQVVDHLDELTSKATEDESLPYVGAYWPLRGEIDPLPAVTELMERGWRAALPVCGADASMDFCPWEPGDYLEEGAYGIAEPTTAPIDLEQLKAVIVPGVGFDLDGNRIGHGVGFYDRFFARLAQHGYDPYRLGLAYEFQIVELPTPKAWDVPVHAVIFPSKPTVASPCE